MDWEIVRVFLESVISLFAIVNPIGNLPIFAGVTQDMSPRDSRRLLQVAAVVGFAVVCIMGIGGKFILSHVFNVNMSEFMFGGGILLVVIGVRNIISSRIETEGVGIASQVSDLLDRRLHMAVSPIAIPLLVGPGAIATGMLVADQRGMTYALMTFVATFVLVGLVLRYSAILYRVIGKLGTLAIGRLMQIFIVAIGAHFVFKALRDILPTLNQAVP